MAIVQSFCDLVFVFFNYYQGKLFIYYFLFIYNIYAAFPLNHGPWDSERT